MKQLTLIASFLGLTFYCSFSQSNCVTHKQILVCPSIMLYNETNLGQGDNGTSPCNIAGEDVVYEILTPNGADILFVTVDNASNPFLVYLEEQNCGSGICQAFTLGAGKTNLKISVNSYQKYFLWIDSPFKITYNISVGADTGSVYVNIPVTKGNLQLDASMCATPPFAANKPFFQVAYNNIFQTNPMTLSPLFIQGNMCVSVFFKNTTGIEGVKKFTFYFDPNGYANVTALALIPGFYNAGNWVGTKSNNVWTFIFVDSLGTGSGDFTGTPDSCLAYSFCFALTPLSNNPVLTNVIVKIEGDGKGSGFSGFVHSGCCPVGFSGCNFSGGGGGGGNASAFAFGFADPGGSLPLKIVSFEVKTNQNNAQLKWMVMNDGANIFYDVEKSEDGLQWSTISTVKSKPSSKEVTVYESIDKNVQQGNIFYRIKYEDDIGEIIFSSVEKIFVSTMHSISAFPNPAKGLINVSGFEGQIINVKIYNLEAKEMLCKYTFTNSGFFIDSSNLPTGSYCFVFTNQYGTERKIIEVIN